MKQLSAGSQVLFIGCGLLLTILLLELSYGDGSQVLGEAGTSGSAFTSVTHPGGVPLPTPDEADSDNDEMPDEWEDNQGTDKNQNDADKDEDLDGLTNAEEYEIGTYPFNAYTDSDTVKDGEDGWAGGVDPNVESLLAPPRLPVPRYAVIFLPTGYVYEYLNDNGKVTAKNGNNYSLWSGTGFTAIPAISGPAGTTTTVTLGGLDNTDRVALQVSSVATSGTGPQGVTGRPYFWTQGSAPTPAGYHYSLPLPSAAPTPKPTPQRQDQGISLSAFGDNVWYGWESASTFYNGGESPSLGSAVNNGNLYGDEFFSYNHGELVLEPDDGPRPVNAEEVTAVNRAGSAAGIKTIHGTGGSSRYQTYLSHGQFDTGFFAGGGTFDFHPEKLDVEGNAFGKSFIFGTTDMWFALRDGTQGGVKIPGINRFYAMNEKRQAVSDDLWTNFKKYPLKDLLPGTIEGQAVNSVYGSKINNHGVILATINLGGTFRTALLLPIEITFEKVGENAEVEDNKYPTGWDANGNPNAWTWAEGKGKRIFPDAKDKDDQTARNEVYVKVTGPPDGWKVRLKVFDVDDPTPSTKDPANIIDANDQGGEKGGDNRGTAAVFAIGDAAHIDCTMESDVAKISGDLPKLKVGMKPGDNYRVTVILLKPDGTPFDGQSMNGQVTDKAGTGYIPSGNEPASGFSGIVSPMLTVWRKLNIEIDSMGAVPNPKPAPDHKNFTNAHWIESNALDAQPASGVLPASSFYVGGYVTKGSQQDKIESYTVYSTPPKIGLVRFDFSSTSAGIGEGDSFEAYDDDDNFLSFLGLPAPLPRNQFHADIVRGIGPTFAPAYIEIEDANAKGWNPNQTIPFSLNEPVDTAFGSVFNDAKDLADSPNFWAFTVTFGYQGVATTDNDPDTEQVSNGLELGGGSKINGPFISYGFAAIFVEAVREDSRAIGDLSTVSPSALNNPIIQQQLRDRYKNLMLGIVAHEVGHPPGGQSEATDHSEERLMRIGGGPINGVGNDFSPTTIKRFRGANQWTH